MTFAKPILWILIGVFVGAAGSALGAQFVPTLGGIQHPQFGRVKPPPRLKYIDGEKEGLAGNFYFVSDPKSGGCWIAGVGSGDYARVGGIAVAPPSACEP